ncbi:hypothetical protein FIBSPDRAFT_891870 [Athelia psychrophila]|uniref:Uncharacterized protein n=1 Tax=Athelia psychrophila TaxID=1759441 RepID=A0A166J6N5_9AGAM|nr:hypothetical protein FIBSPDRAFT_891870 [Fibularhizoctonia sp. CBS 109695]
MPFKCLNANLAVKNHPRASSAITRATTNILNKITAHVAVMWRTRPESDGHNAALRVTDAHELAGVLPFQAKQLRIGAATAIEIPIGGSGYNAADLTLWNRDSRWLPQEASMLQAVARFNEAIYIDAERLKHPDRYQTPILYPLSINAGSNNVGSRHAEYLFDWG